MEKKAHIIFRPSHRKYLIYKVAKTLICISSTESSTLLKIKKGIWTILKDQWEALCARSCELTAQDVLFFNRSVSVIISYVKQLLTSAVTGLILSALISPVMRCGVAVEQFLSQREFYLNKICLRTFRNSAESCCSGSGRYLLLAVIHKSRNKGGYACELARATDGVSSSLAAVARSVSVQMTWPERGPRYVWC